MKNKIFTIYLSTLVFSVFIILILFQSNCFAITAIDIYNMPQTLEQAKERIELDFSTYYKQLNFSPLKYLNASGKILNEKYIKRAITNPKTVVSPLDGMYLVYGNKEHGDMRTRPSTRTYQGENPPVKQESRYLGYSLSGANFDNPAFPWDGWSGVAAKDFYFIPEPWNVSLLNKRYNLSSTNNMALFLSSNQKLKQKLNSSIKSGIHLKYVQYSAKETVLGLDNSNLKNYSIFWGTKNTPEVIKKNIPNPKNFINLNANYFTKHTNNTTYDWTDFVYILSPPTNFSWGTGFIFMETSQFSTGYLSNVSYMTIPLAPFVATPDYSINILRTGTENGHTTKNGYYESIIKVSKKNFDSKKATMPQLNIDFNNAIMMSINDSDNTVSNHRLEGGVTLCLNSFNDWQNSSSDYKVQKMPKTSHSLSWLNSLEENYSNVNFNTNWRTKKRQILKYANSNNEPNIYFNVEEGKISRYYKIKWKPHTNASLVSLSVEINLDENQKAIIDEINTSNNFEKIYIPMPIYDFSTKIKSTGAEKNNNLASLVKTHNAQIIYSVKTSPNKLPPPVSIYFEADEQIYLNETLTFTKEMKDLNKSTKDQWTLSHTINAPWSVHQNNNSNLISRINLDEKNSPIIPELYTEYNFDFAVLEHEMDTYTQIGEDNNFTLDYDVLTHDFNYFLNKSNPFYASVNIPKSTQFMFFTPVSQITGEFLINLYDPKNILKNVKKVGDGKIYKSNSPVQISPYVSFSATREKLGDQVTSNNYLPNNSNPQENFWLDTMGSSIQRRYVIYQLTDHESQKLGYSVTHGSFSPVENLKNNPLTISARVYNGIELSSSTISHGQISTENKMKKTLIWEGTRYKLPVSRAMLNKNTNGAAKSISHVDGKYDRLFQSQSRVDVNFSTTRSLAEHFSYDRNASFSNPGNKNNHSYLFSPFATDTSLQHLPYPLRAGYYYIPNSVYTVNVKSTIYKRANEPTEHDDIVNEVINAFRINSNLPLHDKNNNNIKHIPFSVEKDYNILSNKKLSYNLPPTDKNLYKNASETTLLQNTNKLFRGILEGYSFTNDPRGQNSWQNYKYREYIKHSDIHKITENTTLTFTLNPRYLERSNIFYNDINTPTDDYQIIVYFKPFSNSLAHTNVSTKNKVYMDQIEINILENRYFDIHSN